MTKERVFRKSVFLARGHIPRRPQAAKKPKAPPVCGDGAFANRAPGSLFLQLPLEDFDLLGQRHIVADQAFDLAHCMQDRGVVTAAKAPADLG